ncbi:Gfo/Idh/MocA family oxidoreductase [Paenibacillus sp. GD4]|jgi:UDP-N-acetylglucosamine 3-dehydrogenase|uniref:Gfo/Idh/MocA family protein n=1 Tax=Paenibacillus sp. GD4 TaxID=3068890 RepID=UPI0027969240|nr:Gfo/Idh/MocA family oxidoreductase [Paenibacillus sp. GD4]MDQ1913574.1 Gfo/Idh/MocA family oxidoreductase [Paenibacillus sp. GD4]
MFRIGLVGAGTMGNTHQRAYRQLDDVTVAAVCDADMEKARRIADEWNAETYGSLAAMLNSANIDAVDICLPTDLHREAVELAAAYGKHVFCEKPIALTVEDASAMIAACKKADVTLMVGHVVRFFPEYRSAREQLQSGKLGKPGVVRTIRSGAFPKWSTWFGDYSRSGGPIIDLAIHDIDYLRWCFGPVRRVFSRTLNGERENFDHSLTLIRFESGVMAHVEASWAYPQGAPFQTSLEVAGTKGMVLYDRDKSNSVVQFGGTASPAGVPESPLAKSPYALELEHFIHCVKNKEVPLTSGEEALESLKIGLAAVQSARTNQPVDVGVDQR